MVNDTIAAIATALNNSGISIIRISGDNALNVLKKIYKPKNCNKKIDIIKSHTLNYGFIINKDKVIDEVLVAVMKAPNTYTREDVVEINCHGGIVVTKKILELVLCNGARPADPGEFTKRAFLNGRIDLSEAEAVMDVINAKNEYALQSSLAQLNGSVYKEIVDIREIIIKDIAFIEAALDDPEHIDIDNYSKKMYFNVNKCLEVLNRMYDTSENGRIIKEGINTVIIGKPNAGKSSLLNTLVGEDRAIVTDIAGTTRDILKEEINLNGINLNVIDTAGIRDTEDTVEKIGVDKAKNYIDKADLIVYVVDSSNNLDKNDYIIIDLIKDKKAIILLNKSDLDCVITKGEIEELIKKDIITISAKDGTGIDNFENIVKDMFFKGKINYNDQVIITNLRHKSAIYSAIESLNNVKKSIEDNMPEDFYSIDMMSAYESLGSIIGESVEDDLVDTIFKEFCMGK